jgi:hypothetical protein
MEVETTPPQPPEVAEAVEGALAEPPREPDPWWKAGIEENIGQ